MQILNLKYLPQPENLLLGLYYLLLLPIGQPVGHLRRPQNSSEIDCFRQCLKFCYLQNGMSSNSVIPLHCLAEEMTETALIDMHGFRHRRYSTHFAGLNRPFDRNTLSGLSLARKDHVSISRAFMAGSFWVQRVFRHSLYGRPFSAVFDASLTIFRSMRKPRDLPFRASIVYPRTSRNTSTHLRLHHPIFGLTSCLPQRPNWQNDEAGKLRMHILGK